jgi:hypothetical protein
VNAFVGAGGEDVLAVGREGDEVEFALGLVEGVEAGAVGDAPEFYGLIGAGRGENFAGRIEGEIENGAVVDVYGAEQFGVGDLPEADGFVVAGGGKGGAVGRKLGIVERVAVAGEFADERAGFGVENFSDAVKAGDAAGDDDPLAVV